ncbi:hypothetical protein PybrP1_000073 [[Pythium] brassicae (nom. inval.)]|nr:hypothetical protein PybrP1_000073 [[Pythium] brassicae (nom. inval.)]
MSKFRHPVVAVSHGPGPLWLLDEGFGGMNKHSVTAQNLRTVFPKIYGGTDTLPKRILFVTAHWESGTSGAFEISKSRAPEMIYDYYGFPSEAYEVADIPVVSVSINDRLDARAHFELGRALQPLRDDDTLIICSGQATHNLRASREETQHVAEWAQGFQTWLDDVLTADSQLTYAERAAQLALWAKAAPYAHLAHPSPDHFSPFIVAAGAGMDESQPGGEKILDGWAMGHMSFATYAWGVAK